MIKALITEQDTEGITLIQSKDKPAAQAIQTAKNQNKIKRLLSKKRLLFAILALLAIVIICGVIWRIVPHRSSPGEPASAVSEQYKKQLPSLKAAVKDDPKSAEARKNYAVALYVTNDLQGAKKQYEQAVEINPKDAAAYNNLANIYRDLGQTATAIGAYDTAITLNPQGINSYANLANVQLYTQKDAPAAIATYKKGLKALPNNTQLLLLLGIAYEQADDTANAKKTYQTILDIDKENAAAKANIERLK